ncbi:galactokinase [Lentisphaera profundi]|uniref:Galactokinase n=1 Tax=Lentisphaera profundi TaxID=1658616 RepID=A0ABY7VS39_9BACT|nr:galactokinase [Lentisphaera profundi]WDE96119.1 galactokinase [Lentisphaera profundi]
MSQNNPKYFTDTFGIEPELLAQAPGRLEVLGNHTDYNEGFVLSTAVNCTTQISFRKIEGDSCQVTSPFMKDGIREFNLNEIDQAAAGKDWTNYIRGVIVALKKNGHCVTAFQALITSDVPLSAGMSSSASLEMALVTGLDELFAFGLDNKSKALIGQACENNYIGANTGLMDQLTSLSGLEGQLVISEYRNVTVNHTPLPTELALVVLNSHVAHDLSLEYNERRQQCENAVATLQKFKPKISALRDVNLDQLISHKNDLEENDYKRALHVVGENQRVHQAQEFLKHADYTAFGQLLFESHQSSMDNFENSCPELDQMIEIAKDSPLCLGARLSGGGFGGISIHLVKHTDAEQYAKEAALAYKQKTGKETQTIICQAAQGAVSQNI